MAQTEPYKTPIEKQRVEEAAKLKQDLNDFMGLFPFGLTRSCINVARGRDFIGFSGLGIMMLPGALLADIGLFPLEAVAGPIVVGRVVFQKLKSRFEARFCDGKKLSKELELFRTSMHKRSELAERLIGNRYITPEDVLPFTLGFTAVHSVGFNEGLVLVGDQKVLESDVDVFPMSAEFAFHALIVAKDIIATLPVSQQREETFMRILVDRMTYKNASDMTKPSQRNFDEIDRAIAHLRLAAEEIQKTLKAL
jgi:hypothetical protein